MCYTAACFLFLIPSSELTTHSVEFVAHLLVKLSTTRMSHWHNILHIVFVFVSIMLICGHV